MEKNLTLIAIACVLLASCCGGKKTDANADGYTGECRTCAEECETCVGKCGTCTEKCENDCQGCEKHSGKALKYESAHYMIASENPVVEVKPGLQRQVLCYNDDIMLVKVIFGEEMVGQRPAPHQHPHAQSSYVVSGKFEFHYGDEVKILGPGDAYYIAPNVPHEAYCLEPGVLIDGFSPLREDFLK